METFSALLALCEGNPPVTGGFPSQRPVTWSFDVLFDVSSWTNTRMASGVIVVTYAQQHKAETMCIFLVIYCVQLLPPLVKVLERKVDVCGSGGIRSSYSNGKHNRIC